MNTKIKCSHQPLCRSRPNPLHSLRHCPAYPCPRAHPHPCPCCPWPPQNPTRITGDGTPKSVEPSTVGERGLLSRRSYTAKIHITSQRPGYPSPGSFPARGAFVPQKWPPTSFHPPWEGTRPPIDHSERFIPFLNC